jgi:transcriptional regulator GlxA family with amidase domain
LNKRRATTHWYGIEKLQKYYPEVIVEHDTLYVHDNDLWTSAGVFAGVDMTLAMVKYDLGPQVALQIARELVMFLVRDGGQSQFSAPVNLQSKVGTSSLTALIAWLESRLDAAITVEQMAEHMNMSVRSLHRHCQLTLAMTPAQLITELRLERSRNLLHEPSVALKSIATLCGFSDSSSLSKAFNRRFGVSPIRYRQHFLKGEPLDRHTEHTSAFSI